MAKEPTCWHWTSTTCQPYIMQQNWEALAWPNTSSTTVAIYFSHYNQFVKFGWLDLCHNDLIHENRTAQENISLIY